MFNNRIDLLLHAAYLVENLSNWQAATELPVPPPEVHLIDSEGLPQAEDIDLSLVELVVPCLFIFEQAGISSPRFVKVQKNSFVLLATPCEDCATSIQTFFQINALAFDILRGQKTPPFGISPQELQPLPEIPLVDQFHKIFHFYKKSVLTYQMPDKRCYYGALLPLTYSSLQSIVEEIDERSLRE